MSKINFYGASGHCKVLIEIALQMNEIGFIYDDNFEVKELMGTKVFHDNIKVFDNWIVAIGNNRSRYEIVKDNRFKYSNLTHSNAIISKSVTLGAGNAFMAGSIVNARTSIENHVIVNTNSNIDHDCIIESFVHIGPGSNVCGGVIIGEGSLIGAGTTIIPGVKIGKWSTIGAGSVVIEDVPDGATVVGNPGKVLRIAN